MRNNNNNYTNYWFCIIILGIAAVVVLIYIIYKKSQNKDSFNKKVYKVENNEVLKDGIILESGKYVAMRDIDTGIYDILVLDGCGFIYTDVPEKIHTFLSDDNKKYNNLEISNNTVLKIDTGLRISLYNKRAYIETSYIEESNTESNITSTENCDIDKMNGWKFENFCADVLKKNGYDNVNVTPGSGDQGVDITAERDGIRYAIQCKRYSQPVGNKAVQEIYAGKKFYHCHVGIIMTNNYFTQSAKELAKENGIILWDRDFLNKYTRIENNDSLNREDDNILRILDAEKGIVAIEDGQVSKALFQYLESASRIAIDIYLRERNDNPYTEDMIRNAEKPIEFYNAKLVPLMPHCIKFVYYCGMNANFKSTKTFEKLIEISKENNRDREDDLFKIDVFYKIDDILLNNKEIKIKKTPEVNISSDSLEGIKLLEEIDEYDKQTGNKYLVTEYFFPMKFDNIKIAENIVIDDALPDKLKTLGYDPYLLDAGRFVLKKEKVSIGMLQREFKIGYNRGEKIINELIEIGVIKKTDSEYIYKSSSNPEQFELIMKRLAKTRK